MGKKIFIGIVVLVLIIGVLLMFSKIKISGRAIELGDNSYEELCNANGDMWMEMEPWRDKKKISDEKCFGCMIGENHFCTAEEYVGYIKERQKMLEVMVNKK